MVTIAFTTACWVLTAYLAPQTSRETLIAFYRKVRPFGPGWAKIRREACLTPEEEAAAPRENIPLALLGWLFGCTMVWSALFTVGNVLYGRWNYAIVLGIVFVLSALCVVRIINILWSSVPKAEK